MHPDNMESLQKCLDSWRNSKTVDVDSTIYFPCQYQPYK